MIQHLVIVIVGKVGSVDLGVSIGPVLGGHDGNTGAGLHHLGPLVHGDFRLYGSGSFTHFGNVHSQGRIQVGLCGDECPVHAVDDGFRGDGGTGNGINVVPCGEGTGIADELAPEVAFFYQVAQSFGFLVHGRIDEYACHLAAVTDAHLNLHIAVAALAGNVEHHACVRSVELVDALRGGLLFLGGGTGENTAELQILGPVILRGWIDQIPDKVAGLVDTAADGAGGDGGTGDGIHTVTQLSGDGEACKLGGKIFVLGLGTQTGGLSKLAAAHGDSGDNLLQVHAHMDLHGAAEAGDGDLGNVTCQLAIHYGGISAVHTAVGTDFQLLKSLCLKEAFLPGSVGSFNGPLLNWTFRQFVDDSQQTADGYGNKHQDQPGRDAEFHGKLTSLSMIKERKCIQIQYNIEKGNCQYSTGNLYPCVRQLPLCYSERFRMYSCMASATRLL